MIIQLEQTKYELSGLSKQVDELGVSIGVDKLAGEVAALEKETTSDGFWDDSENSQKILKELKFKKGIYDRFVRLRNDLDSLMSLGRYGYRDGRRVCHRRNIGGGKISRR